MKEISYEAMYKLRYRAVDAGCTEEEMVRRFRLMWEPLGGDWVASKIVWALWREGLDTPQKVADADLDRLVGIRNLGGKCLIRLGEFRASVKADVPRETSESEDS